MNKEEILTELALYVKPDDLEVWLDKPNPVFGDSNPPPTPRSILDAGMFYQFESMLAGLRGDVGS
jgi:hypothetical protein